MAQFKKYDEFVNESSKFPNEVKGNHGIVWKKQREQNQGTRTVANYVPFYKGYDIDFGGHTFGSTEEMEKYIKSYVLSSNVEHKYKYMPEIKESVDDDIELKDKISQKLFKCKFHECDTEDKVEVLRMIKTHNHK